MSFEDAARGTETTLLLDDGSGQRSVKVRIPAGVANGQTIRIAGRGAAGRDGGPAGDLFVEIKVRPHRHFRRSGNDLTITVPVTFPEAALGADIKVPTLSGKPVTVRIPAGTSSGRTLRVRGQGVESKSAKGDLLVTVAVHVPQRQSDAERDLVEQLAAAEEGRPSPRDDLGLGSRWPPPDAGGGGSDRRPVCGTTTASRATSSRWPRSWPVSTPRRCASTNAWGWSNRPAPPAAPAGTATPTSG
jgi:hypothetical protein